MTKQIYVNLPVNNVSASTAFYEALGFVKNEVFSDDKASSMMWSDQIVVMLLSKDFYQSFLKDKEIGDSQKTNLVLLALSLESKEAVQQFAETAKAEGGDFYRVDMGVSEEMMVGYEVTDLDGHMWEPMWMNSEFKPE